MNAFELAATYRAASPPPPAPPREVQPVKTPQESKYRVQMGDEVKYEGTSWPTATQLFSSLARVKPKVGILLLTNGNVSRRYVPRKEVE